MEVLTRKGSGGCFGLNLFGERVGDFCSSLGLKTELMFDVTDFACGFGVEIVLGEFFEDSFDFACDLLDVGFLGLQFGK